MSTKEQTYSGDKETNSKQQSQKASAKDLNMLAHKQPDRAILGKGTGSDAGSFAALDTLQLQRTIGNRSLGRLLSARAPAGTANGSNSQRQSVQRKDESIKVTRTALPNNLKAGIESLSGIAMDDVKVHHNSSKPAEVQASAHTQGSNVYVGPGQEKHLPHEAWHVVQQKQGRVKPTDVQAKGASINDDPGLEREADQMGAKALEASSVEDTKTNELPVAQSVQREVMQLKNSVPTGFGNFKTTKFDDADDAKGKGVDIDLAFDPDKTKVDATKIALAQSIRNTTSSGVDYPLGVTKSSRMVPSNKPGGGYAIDAESTGNNPIYFNTKSLGPKEELKDTPMSNPANPNYQLGYCYKEKEKDKDKRTQPATLADKPRSTRKGQSQTFETAAFPIEGKDKDKYYGSVKWGYKIEGTDAAPKVVSSDITLASPAKGKAQEGTPTENFLEAAKVWNAGESQGTLQVAADIRVKKTDSQDKVMLKKGTRLKQTAAGLSVSEVPIIRAEVLNPDGTGTGVEVGLRHTDVEDIGGGSANKKLPIPAAKSVAKPAVKK